MWGIADLRHEQAIVRVDAACPNDMFRSSADFLVERFGTDPNIEDVITEIDSLIDSNMEDRLQHFTLVTPVSSCLTVA